MAASSKSAVRTWGRAAVGGNDGEMAVGIVVELSTVGGNIGDLTAVGRPPRVAIRAAGIEYPLP